MAPSPQPPFGYNTKAGPQAVCVDDAASHTHNQTSTDVANSEGFNRIISGTAVVTVTKARLSLAQAESTLMKLKI